MAHVVRKTVTKLTNPVTQLIVGGLTGDDYKSKLISVQHIFHFKNTSQELGQTLDY